MYTPYSIYMYSKMSQSYCGIIGAMFFSAGGHINTVWKADPIPHFPAVCAGWLNLSPELWYNAHNNAKFHDWESITFDRNSYGWFEPHDSTTSTVTTAMGVSRGYGSEMLVFSGPSLYADTAYNAFGQGLYMPMACGGFAAAAFVFMQGNISHHNHYFGILNANYLFDEEVHTGAVGGVKGQSLAFSSIYGCEQNLQGGRQLMGSYWMYGGGSGCNFGTSAGWGDIDSFY